MSQQSAQAFVTQASQNHELLAQVAQSAGKLQMLNSPQGLTLATEQYEAATTVARQGGYDFNPSELESAFIAFVATHRDLLANRQLTEADATIGERCRPERLRSDGEKRRSDGDQYGDAGPGGAGAGGGGRQQ